MKNRIVALLLSVMIIFFVATISHAAPSLDGDSSDWGSGTYSEFDGYVRGNYEYRVDKIGLFVDEGKLLWMLDTGYELNYKEDDTTPGDFYVKIFQDGTNTVNGDDLSANFGIRYDIDDIQGQDNGTIGVQHDVDIKLYHEPGWTWVRELEDGYSGDWVRYRTNDQIGVRSDGVIAPITPSQNNTSNATGTFLGFHNDIGAYKRYGTDPNDPISNTLEGAINLNLLTDALGNLNADMAYDVKIMWTMSCGNDAQGYTLNVGGGSGGGNPIPEPGTFLLFGMGLLSLGALGRRKEKEA